MFTIEDYKHSVGLISNDIQKNGVSVDALRNILTLCASLLDELPEEKEYCFALTKYVKQQAQIKHIETCNQQFGDLYWRSMLIEAPYLFESFIFYLEKNRAYSKKIL